jgi:hypothetical protein
MLSRLQSLRPAPTGFFSLLITLLLLQACTNQFQFQQVDDPNDLTQQNLAECRLVIVGRVLDARNGLPLSGAAIQIGDLGAISLPDGRYRIEVEDVFDPLEAERLLWAVRPGYELLSFQFDPTQWVFEEDCIGSITYVCLDLVMSRRNPPIVIQPGAPTDVEIRDTTIYQTEGPEQGFQFDTVITVMNLRIPAGAVDVPTQLSISSYARPSYLGAQSPNATLYLPELRFRIATNPMIKLNQPFTLSFRATHPAGFDPEDALGALRMNDQQVPFQGFSLLSNQWRPASETEVQFNLNQQVIQVRSTQLGSYMITNQNQILSYKENYSAGAAETLINLNNCDCSEALLLEYPVRFDGRLQWSIENVNSLSLVERLIYLNDAKILVNTPFGSLLQLSKGAPVNLYNIFIPDGEKIIKEKVLLGKCRQLFVTGEDIFHQMSGVQYGDQYSWNRAIGQRITFNFQTCPITSSCHQGCP